MRSLSQTLALSLAALGIASQMAKGADDTNFEQFKEVWQEVVRESARWTSCDAAQEDIAADAILSLAGKDPEYIQRCLSRTVKNKLIDRVRRRHGEVELSALGEDSARLVEESAISSEASLVDLPVINDFRGVLGEEELQVLGLLEEGLPEREMATRLGTTRYDIRKRRETLEQKATDYFELAS